VDALSRTHGCIFLQNPYFSNTSMASSHYTTKHCPSLFHSFRTCSISNHKTALEYSLISRRCLTSISLGATLLYKDFFSASSTASAVEFRWTVPGQSLEDAYTKVRLHATNLLKIKASIDSKSWKEAHITLKEASPLLKQDMYTIIQKKPPNERGELRRLYTYLFNNVTTVSHKIYLYMQFTYIFLLPAQKLNERLGKNPKETCFRHFGNSLNFALLLFCS
jgi:Oxygen evolving enhancer protein 3 (PsbQ)